MLRSLLFEACNRSINYIKLRFAINILDDIRVCEVGEENENTFSAEVYQNAAKTNIESSETYRRLCGQCGA